MKLLIIQVLALAMSKAVSAVSPDPDTDLHQCSVLRTETKRSELRGVWHPGNSTCSGEKCLLKIEVGFI